MPGKIKFILPAALLALATAIADGGERAVGGEWPIYHGDAALRGVAAAIAGQPVELWRLKTSAPVSSPPVVGGGKIYFVTDDGHAHAATLKGEKIWSARIIPLAKPAPPEPGADPEKLTTPPLYVRGLVLAGSKRGSLYAFDAGSGAVKWIHAAGGNLNGSPNWIEKPGCSSVWVVAVSQPSGSVHCVELAGGKPVWASKPTDRCDGSPAVGSNFVVFGNCASELQVLAAASGAEMAQIRFPERGPVAEGVAVDGSRVYAGTRDGTLVCADASSGRIVWTNQFGGGEAFATPAVTADRIVCASKDGLVACLARADGNKIWDFKCENEPLSPVVAGDRVVVAAGGTLYILKLVDGAKAWSARTGDRITSPAVAGGRIYIGTDEGFIVCYGSAGEKP